MKKLAVLGASYLQLPLIKKAREMGVETHCFAWGEGAVCKEFADFFYPVSVLDKEEILQICQKIGIDGITTIATDISVPTICYVATKLKLVGNSEHSAFVSTNKFAMRNAFKANDVSIPKFREIKSIEEVEDNCSYPIIVKPVDRSGSRGVAKVERFSALSEAVKEAISESITNTAIIEDYIEGKEVSVESISWKGKHYILAITDKVTTEEPHFVELAHHQPSKLSEVIQAKIKVETIKALDALEIKYGAGHSEFKITEEGEIFAIEVGARMGGDFIGSHLVELSTGYDFLRSVVEVALNSFEVPVQNLQNAAGVYFLSKETESILEVFEKTNSFEVEKEIQNTNLVNITNSNDRSGYLIYRSSERIELL